VSYRVVTCDDAEMISDDIWTVLNTKCSEALSSHEEHVAVQLRPEMGSGVPLLDWIGKWQESFSQKGKNLYIITDNQQQLESMELSHPDQNLAYCTSLHEFEEQMEPFSADDAEGQRESGETVPAEEIDTRENFDSTGSQIPSSLDEKGRAVIMAVGETVEIAGEYICQSCGTSRMWMKGKTVTRCQNPECFDQSKGWQLDFDLF
jgi:hypothetical protein